MKLTPPAVAPRQYRAAVAANRFVSTGLIQLTVVCDAPFEFLPGQFAMLNFTGVRKRTFGRPFSILACDGERVEFLYRVVGGGTADLADLVEGEELIVLGPLGKEFPGRPDDREAVLLAGGVGLPPVLAWWHRYGRETDRAYFGGRDAGDLPRELLPAAWRMSIDSKEPGDEDSLFEGRVPDLARSDLAGLPAADRFVLSCGPAPLLAAAGKLAAENGWDCFVSMEEHMGCGYGACKGCVIPLRPLEDSPGEWRNATCCQEGPVFRAEDVVWNRIL